MTRKVDLSKIKGELDKRDPIIWYTYGKFTSGDAEEMAKIFTEDDKYYNRLNDIKKISRKSSYYQKTHKSYKRREEIFARLLYSLELTGYDDIGEIIDYQVPLKNKQTDRAGKIDLISCNGKTVYLIELKSVDSKESLLRGILEIATYYNQVDREKLLNDYNLNKRIPIRKGLLLFGGNFKHSGELKKIKAGESTCLQKLINKLEIDIFTIDLNIKKF